jgi:hypothetical protein
LLQIFTKLMQDRPTLFLEVIQRHNHQVLAYHQIIWYIGSDSVLETFLSSRYKSQMLTDYFDI